jgi:anthranilate phosphoribosyltransferase
METLLSLVRSGAELTAPECGQAVEWLADSGAPAAQKEAFLEALRVRTETASEIAGFAAALIGRAKDPGVVAADLPGPTLDVCGTGGDKLDLFNISTTAMFVLAAGGAVVVKHGNRAITSQCGGADVLEELGVRIEVEPAKLRRCLESAGVGFVFAPAYHPAFAVIGPVRRALAARGVPTIFNLLGPLLNPVKPPFQLVGVYAASLLPKYAEALRLLGRKRAWVVNGEGADELTCAGASEVYCTENDVISRLEILPESLRLRRVSISSLRGGNRAENARMLVDVLSGEDQGARCETVLLNAAAGFVVAGLEPDLDAGLERGRRVIRDGLALAKLRSLVELTR